MQRELNIRACYTIELSALFFGLATSHFGDEDHGHELQADTAGKPTE